MSELARHAARDRRRRARARAGGTPSGPGSRRCWKRTWRSPRSRRTRSATRARSTRCSRLGRAARPTSSRSTGRRRSTARRRSSSCGSCRTGARRSRATCSTRPPMPCGIAALKESDDAEVAGLAAKIEREEAYHLMHVEMWAARLLSTGEGTRRLREGVERLWPLALGVLEPQLQRGVARKARRAAPVRAARRRAGAARRAPRGLRRRSGTR